MKFSTTLGAFALIATAVSGNVFAKNANATQGLSIDSKVEVAYSCVIDQKHNQKMTVMYGIKNGEPIVAQAKINNVISTGMFRQADPLLNRFVSESSDGTMWTTLPAKADQLRNTQGGTLSFKQNGKNTIIVEKCQVDKAATAKLK